MYRIRGVASDDQELFILLENGAIVKDHIQKYPILLRAHQQQKWKELDNYQIVGDGWSIHWPDLDEDIAVANILGIPD